MFVSVTYDRKPYSSLVPALTLTIVLNASLVSFSSGSSIEKVLRSRLENLQWREVLIGRTFWHTVWRSDRLHDESLLKC
ncbi:hypothetical protein K469DRAFT_63017 [Zopfia rhizophila CBS 207.26]|uniref:Uncharacterized protein n=1 Tax=Zopfia rhizophila CBS 207.26 TaxID=1314779 RepID=A0A6A6EC30_9PEZI|nr:hypothetical protein K469DRAFT_63017 [Zopfia rhizophila CBS 207.26]